MDWVAWPIAPWAFDLNNLYWRLRQVRTDRELRFWYRRIEAAKLAAIRGGVDAELVRLVCRYFKDPRDAARVRRIEAREAELTPEPVEAFTGRQVWQKGVDDD